ncbi:helical backbone metal receptor [Ideonella sp. DXS22W]|uniref:Helical backbone metal receptor n=1 Tax=Pseudaquabacterium inlustre TaxID=2984192 RepID=A0ABU9CL71_9BURK
MVNLMLSHGRRAVLLAALAMAGSLTSPARAATLDLTDDRGTVHHLPASPKRIVTLLPSLTESVWALGGGTRLVGVDRYSNWPEALAKLPRLGGLDDVQIEAIAALKPDVVLASTSARSLDRLEALGFTVLRLKSETQADVRRTLGLLARMLGTPAEGERVWAAIDARMAAAAQRVPPALRGKRVYFEIGGGPWAAGSSSFMGELLTRLALGNIVPASMGPFPKLNPEFVLRERPDIVMGPKREADDMASRPGWASLAALQQRQRCAFDTAPYELLIRPGPRMGEAADVLADCLQALPAVKAGKS